MKRLVILSTVLWMSAPPCFAEPPAAELLEVTKIWDRAPHSAFTDLAYWKDQFVCAFREGRAHVSTDGTIRVLTSADGREWKSSASIGLDGYDLRDAGLSIAPHGRLMLIGGASPRPTDAAHSPTGSFVSFSDDAKTWTKPQIVAEPGRWLWRVTWHDGKAYGVLYEAGSDDRTSALLVSQDGVKYRTHVRKHLDDGRPTEAVLRFNDDDTMYCLQRRDGQAPSNTAMLGVSKPPYTDWDWHDLGHYFGGPNLIQMPSGDWIAAGRLVRDGNPKTVLAWLDVENKSLEPFLELPSGGDTSYPGLVLRDGVLWISYYSSHEGKANIYVAKVANIGGEPAPPNLASRAVPGPVHTVSISKPAPLNPAQSAACDRLKLDKNAIEILLAKPLYEFTEIEVDTYLRFLSATEPELRKRIIHLARRNIGQPYEIYLLGEMPFEPYDPQPLYCLGKSDCLVFAEHTYAMALSHNWPSFMKMLQRIRYRDGKIGVATRNHYTEADWNISNRWLVEDITEKLADGKAVTFEQKIDRAKFLKNRYKLDVDIPIEKHKDSFLRFEDIDRAKGALQDGDFVNIVRGTVNKDAPPSELSNTFGGSAWVGHVGMIVLGDYGEVHLIHSSEPRVREEPIDEYIARSTKNMKELDAKGKPRLLGFKFLRLRDRPFENLREVDGEDAPKVTLPDGSEAKF
ncbi:MAG: DUF1460 domain-containing protein [Planctomycetes bacterium]|nr:DUF1460 domain-containing protein [Planctomycetota bacterium]